jgi:hypothetical protein
MVTYRIKLFDATQPAVPTATSHHDHLTSSLGGGAARVKDTVRPEEILGE